MCEADEAADLVFREFGVMHVLFGRRTNRVSICLCQGLISSMRAKSTRTQCPLALSNFANLAGSGHALCTNVSLHCPLCAEGMSSQSHSSCYQHRVVSLVAAPQLASRECSFVPSWAKDLVVFVQMAGPSLPRHRGLQRMVHEGFRTRRVGCCSKSLVWAEGRVLKRGVFVS